MNRPHVDGELAELLALLAAVLLLGLALLGIAYVASIPATFTP